MHGGEEGDKDTEKEDSTAELIKSRKDKLCIFCLHEDRKIW